MGFCFCLSSHVRTKHSIFCLYKCRSYLETKPILKSTAGQEILETGATYFGSTNVPSSFEIPSHVYSRVCSSKWSLGTNNKHPRDRFRGPVSQQGWALLAPEGFSRSTNIETVLRIQVYFLKQKSFLMDLANTLYHFIV